MPYLSQLFTVVDTYPCLSETFVDREIQEFRRQGLAVEVVALRGQTIPRIPGPQARRLVPSILRDHLCDPRRCLSLLRRAGQTVALAERLQGQRTGAHLLAQFAWTTTDVARLASRLAGVPFSVRAHAWDVFTQSPRALRQRLDSATQVLPCNTAAFEAVRACGFPPERITMVHHGLDLADPAWRWQEPAESTRILGIGRLVPKKGVGVLLDACTLLARDRVRFSLQWIGDGPERIRLMRHTRTLGLQAQANFTGALSPEETRTRLRGAALLVLPSLRSPGGDRDGIANVLVEAMALGIPVVSTTAAGAPEILTHAVNGLLVPPEDPAALADAIRQILLDTASQRLALAQAARSTVEREFDLSRNVARILRILSHSPD